MKGIVVQVTAKALKSTDYIRLQKMNLFMDDRLFAYSALERLFPLDKMCYINLRFTYFPYLLTYVLTY